MAGSSNYPDDWDKRRRRVYERDGYTCQSCGAQGGQAGNTELHAHHIKPISQGGSHKLGNLTTLCRNCHNQQHDHDISSTSRKRRSQRRSTPTGIKYIIAALVLSGIAILTPQVLTTLFGGILGILMIPVIAFVSMLLIMYGIIQSFQ